MREFLKGLDLDDELIDSIMAEHGKLVTKDKEAIQTLKSELSSLKENSKDGEDWKKKYEDLDNLIKTEQAKKKAEDEDKILTNNIVSVFGNKKFTSDYAKNGFIQDIKNELNKPENKGKGISDLVTELSKSKKGVFAVENQVIETPSTNENVDNVITKDKFNKMSYNERLQLKQDNPDLFKKLNE